MVCPHFDSRFLPQISYPRTFKVPGKKIRPFLRDKTLSRSGFETEWKKAFDIFRSNDWKEW
jgi:hypothetical protein